MSKNLFEIGTTLYGKHHIIISADDAEQRYKGIPSTRLRWERHVCSISTVGVGEGLLLLLLNAILLHIVLFLPLHIYLITMGRPLRR